MRSKIIAGAACAGLAAVFVAACSGSNSGSETFAGTSTSLATDTVPINATGVLNDHGSISLAGNSDKGTFVLKQGDVYVVHSKGMNSEHVDAATCVAKSTTTGTYNVTGGSRSYKGASGHGDFKIVFSGTLPRVNGACANPSTTEPISGRLMFRADGTATLG